jgi:hypothetical protein
MAPRVLLRATLGCFIAIQEADKPTERVDLHQPQGNQTQYCRTYATSY